MLRPVHAPAVSSLPLLLALGACAAPGSRAGSAALECAEGWRAELVLDRGETGIWTVEALPVFQQYGSPEVVALDDAGRCTVLVSYSGRWTPLERVNDGAWLGGLAHGDVDPRVEGAELYTGGRKGNLYQLVPHPHGALDARLIAHLPGLELHTILAGDLDPSAPGAELLIFTRPGALYRVSPTGADGGFEVQWLGSLPGRVRDALVLPAGPDRAPRIVTASRDGTLGLLRPGPGVPHLEVLHREPMGFGRLALGADAEGGAVLYATLDDGRVLRLAEGDAWAPEVIFAGPQGPRGVARGRFHADPAVESVAVFGYSGAVQLLTRTAAGDWEVETLFEDRDRGHWLAVAELDGRNGTDELLGSGYGGRVFLLARPPGFGRPGVATDSGTPEGER